MDADGPSAPIVRGAVEPVELALDPPLATARGVVTVRRGFRLRLVSATGAVGLGEASPAYWLGETSLARTAADLRKLVAALEARPRATDLRRAVAGGTLRSSGGRPAREIPHHEDRVAPERDADEDDREAFALLDTPASGARLRALPLSPAAASAVDTALLDLEATAAGVPACTLLGGDPSLPLSVCALLAGSGRDTLARAAETAVAAGFRTLKLKVGHAPLAADVGNVEAIRARVGAGVALRLDANRAWTLGDARRALAALEPLGIELLEEPLREPRPGALAALAASTRVPLALDESVRDATTLARIAAGGAVRALVVKAARLGGPSRLVALARTAAARGLDVVVTDSIESAVGMGAAVHAAAAVAPAAGRGAGGRPSPRAQRAGGCLAIGLGGARIAGSATAALAAPVLRAVGPGFRVRGFGADMPGRS